MALSQLIYRRTVRLLVYPGKVLFARLNCWFNFLPSCWFSHNLFFGTTKVADDEKKRWPKFGQSLRSWSVSSRAR